MQELKRAGEKVRAASRNPVGSDSVHLDWGDPSTFQPALAGVDGVFLMSPGDEFHPEKFLVPFLEKAANGRRKIVLMTESSTEFNEGALMRPVETALQKSGAPFVILRPSWFMDNFHTFWLEPIQKAGIIPLPAADSRSAFIDSRDIGAAAAAALRTDRFDGHGLTLTGPAAVTYSEAAAVLSQAASREIRYVPVDDAAFVNSLVDVGLEKSFAEYLAALFRITREDRASTVTSTVQDLTGRPPRGLSEYARDHAPAWRP